MDPMALLLSRLQFAFTVSFHIIFPSFTIGLAAWLTVLEALHLRDRATGVPPGLRVLAQDLRRRVRARRRLRHRDGVPVRHQLERAGTHVRADPGAAAFLRDLHRLRPRSQLLRRSAVRPLARARHGSICSRPRWWRSAPRCRPSGSWSTTVGCRCRSAMSSRMVSLFRTTGPRSCSVRCSGCAFRTCCLRRTSPAPSASPRPGAWYLLRREFAAEARIMLRMGLGLAAVLVPVQLVFGHLCGEYVVHHQPSKMAAIEARWHDEQPASEVLLAWPDVAGPAQPLRDHTASAVRQPDRLGQPLGGGGRARQHSRRRTGRRCVIPFFTFRIMVGCGLIMLLLAWIGSYLGPQRPPRAEPAAALGDVPQLSAALHRDTDRLVHRRGRAPALGGLRRCCEPPTR